MPRKRLTIIALHRQLLATRKQIHELKRELAKITEKLDIEPKDAIGFQFTPTTEEEDEDE